MASVASQLFNLDIGAEMFQFFSWRPVSIEQQSDQINAFYQ